MLVVSFSLENVEVCPSLGEFEGVEGVFGVVFVDVFSVFEFEVSEFSVDGGDFDCWGEVLDGLASFFHLFLHDFDFFFLLFFLFFFFGFLLLFSLLKCLFEDFLEFCLKNFLSKFILMNR